MEDTIDKVKIEIEASAKSAEKSIEGLIKALAPLREAVSAIDTSGLRELSDSVAGLSESLRNVPNRSVFNNLARGIERLSQIDTSGIGAVSNAINELTGSVAALNASGANNVQVNVPTANVATPDVSGATSGAAAANAQQMAAASGEAQAAMDGMRDSMQETAAAEENVGRTTMSLGERMAALRANLTRVGESVRNAFSHPVSTASGGLRALADAASQSGSRIGMVVGGIINVMLRVGQVAGGIARAGLHAFTGGLKMVASAARTIAPRVASAAKGIVKMTASFVKSASVIGVFSGAVNKAKMALGALGPKLQMVTRLFTFMLLRSAITHLFMGVGEALEHLAKKSSEANQKISALISSCRNFQHQVAALTVPLLDLFGPALTKIIDLLAKAISYINQFLSALAGKKFYTAAKKQNYDYAASLDKTSKKAKKAKKDIRDATYGLDELNIIKPDDNEDDDANDDSNGGAGALEDCYEQLAINEKILEMVEKLKALLRELFEPIRQAWEDYGQGVMDAFNYAISSCKKAILDMGKTWKDVWLNGSGYELCKNILLLLTSILNWIGDIATAWDKAWQKKGYENVQSIFDALNAVLVLIIEISESFRRAFNNGAGQVMFEHILQILTDVNYIVANLATGFTKAWKAAGTGDAIAASLFKMFNIVLGCIERITGSTREWAKNLDFGPLLTSVKNLLEKTEPLVQKISDALSWVWENVILPLGKWAIETALPKVIDAVAAAFEALDAILEVLKPIFLWIWDHMLKPLAEWTGGTIVDIIDGITEAFEGISEVFKKISDGEDWGEIGNYIWEGLIDGIKNVGGWVWEKLTEAFGGIVDFVKDLLGIHSPSTVFADIGKNTIDGFVEGVESKKETAKGPIRKWAESVINWFSGGDGEGNIAEKFKKFGNDIVSGFREKVGGTYTTVKTKVTDWGTGVKEWFYGKGVTLKENFTEYANGIITGFREKVGNAYTTTKNNVTTWAAKVKEWYTSSGFGGVNSNTFSTYAANIIDGFKTKVGSYYTTAKSNILTWATKVRSWFTDDGEVNNSKFQTFAANIIDGFKDKVGSYYTAARTNIATWGSKVVTWFEEKCGKSAWETVAVNIIDGFKNKMGALYTSCKETIQSWGSDVLKWFKEKLNISSPSKEFQECGLYSVEGYAKGVDDNGESKTKAPITSYANDIKKWFTDPSFGGINSESFQNFAGTVVTAFSTKIGNYYPSTMDNMVTWASKVREWFTSSSFGGVNSTNFQTYATNSIDGYKTRIGNYHTTSQSNMVTWGTKVRDWFTNSGFGGVNSTNFQTYATNSVDGYKNRIGGYYTSSGTNMTTWGNYVKTTFTNAGANSSTFYEVASNVVNGFKNGIGALYATCRDNIESWGKAIIEWFKDKLGVKSPSRVFKEIGQFTVAGFNAGLDDSADSTKDHMKEWLGKFQDFQTNITAKVNVKEVMEKYTPKYDTGISTGAIERTVRQEINTEGRVRATLESGGGFASAIEEVINRTISRQLEGIEKHTRIQAEKKETTNVYVGNREVTKAVDQQRRDNGFSFTPAMA